MEKVANFKYLGPIITYDRTLDVKPTSLPEKKRKLELTPIWKDMGMHTDVELMLLKALVWTVVTDLRQGWSRRLKMSIKAAEKWFYKELLRLRWRKR